MIMNPLDICKANSFPVGKEVLIHNLSHSDLILGIEVNSNTSEIIVARPKFSQFNAISHNLYDQIFEQADAIQLASSIGYAHRDSDSGRPISIGYELPPHPDFRWDINQLRFRDEDKLKLSHLEAAAVTCRIKFVYFPLITVLLFEWLKHMKEEKAHEDFLKVLVLVSGRGEPIDNKARDLDNSTEFTGKLIQLFIGRLNENIEVHLLHSTTNLFRYDANIAFVKHELLPKIVEIREDLLYGDDPKWREKLKLILSFADGSTARISAINASLKHFRPSYMHFWVLKTFWREKKIFFDDVEFHTYQEISTEIAMEIDSNKDPLVAKALEEMKLFREKISASLQTRNELANFWLRKTKKLVLAVLVVERNGELISYSGTNMEVSMPTGSLCAERNVIGTALAADITLRRKDIKVVAVYSVPNIDKAYQPTVRDKSNDESDEPDQKRLKSHHSNHETTSSDSTEFQYSLKSPAKSPTAKRKIFLPGTESFPSSQVSPVLNSFPRLNPLIRKEILFEQASPSVESEKTSSDQLNFCSPNPGRAYFKSIDVEITDLNPIKPCGACNEWLKKIAEVNPSLKVVTFTDAHCKGIFVENITE